MSEVRESAAEAETAADVAGAAFCSSVPSSSRLRLAPATLFDAPTTDAAVTGADIVKAR